MFVLHKLGADKRDDKQGGRGGRRLPPPPWWLAPLARGARKGRTIVQESAAAGSHQQVPQHAAPGEEVLDRRTSAFPGVSDGGDG